MHDFQVLDDRNHCMMRPGVYLGSIIEEPISGIINFTYQTKNIVPALVKCVEEIYQNCIDHHIKTGYAYAKNISVKIQRTVDGTEVIVTDDGKGIPCVKLDNGQYIPVVAWTTLRAGSNFDDSNRVGAGTNGMGAALVSIFSNQFIGITDDGVKRIRVTCTDNMANIEHDVTKSKGVTGTQVRFYPDLARFGLTEFTQDHIDVVRDRLTNLAIMYPTITFTFNDEVIKFKNIKQVAKNFSDDAVCYSDDKVSMVFSSSGSDEEFRCLSYLNGIYIKNGGTHVDYVMNRVIDLLREAIQKKHKISVLPNQIKQHILFASWISGFNAPKFDSQVKERLTNTQSEVSVLLGSIDYEKIVKQILGTPSIVDPMIAAILYKKELAEKLALQKLQKEQSKTNLRKISKFTDASTTDRESAILCVVEGDSAAASVLSARTPIIGCYPLKGKMINAMDATTKDLLANKEFVDLMTVTGLTFGEPPNNIRFGKIAITSDQDYDGNHIAGLFVAAIRKHWPKLLLEGRIYRFRTPLMKVIIGKTEQYFYSLTEFNEWAANNKTKKYQTRYLKGLGSSTAQDFRKYFENMDNHLVKIEVDTPTDLEVVDLVFGKGKGMADKRKEWLDLEDSHVVQSVHA